MYVLQGVHRNYILNYYLLQAFRIPNIIYRGFSPYANFITAIFITAIFQKNP